MGQTLKKFTKKFFFAMKNGDSSLFCKEKGYSKLEHTFPFNNLSYCIILRIGQRLLPP